MRMKLMGGKSILCLVLVSILLNISLGTVCAIDRFLIPANINGQPVIFIFDTGSDNTFLFRLGAERLGLKIKHDDFVGPMKPGYFWYDVTEEFTWGSSKKIRLPVTDDIPGCPPSFDGIINWQVCSNLVFQIDTDRRVGGFSPELPLDLKSWSKWKLVPDFPVMAFECSNGSESARIGIDTGSDAGVWLSATRWQRWRGERAGLAATLVGAVNMAGETMVNEELRARTIRIAGITLNDMPVSSIPPSIHIFDGCDAVFGLGVFGQLRLVVDGTNGRLYTKPSTNSQTEYAYNRLGAVFPPKDRANDDLIAHVIKDSPAYRAGIRDGDILLKIGILDVTVWRTDPYILPFSRFFSQAPGTKHKLTLKRGDKRYETTVTLEELPTVE
jgi:Aspartyl protease/PDZ domain